MPHGRRHASELGQAGKARCGGQPSGLLGERQGEAGFQHDERQDQAGVDGERCKRRRGKAPAHVQEGGTDGGERHAQHDGKGETGIERHKRQGLPVIV
jgi:hypothetical protein